jgi:hypothetical protein
MGYPIDALRTFFRETDVTFENLPDQGESAHVGWLLSGRNARYDAWASDLPTGHLWMYVIAPFRVPEHRRARAAELLARVNYGLRWGVFEVDCEDGELRYRTSSLVPLGEGQQEILDDLFHQAFRVMDDFFPLLVEGVFASDPVGVAYRRLYSAMADASDDAGQGNAAGSEVLEAVDRIGRGVDAPEG